MTQRETLSTTETADKLGCTRQNVQDLYRRGQLEGPPREPRSPVLIYVDSVEDYRTRRPRRRASASVDQGYDPSSVLVLLESIDRRLQVVEETLAGTVEQRKVVANNFADLDALRMSTVEEYDKLLAAMEAQRKTAQDFWTRAKEHVPVEMPSEAGS